VTVRPSLGGSPYRIGWVRRASKLPAAVTVADGRWKLEIEVSRDGLGAVYELTWEESMWTPTISSGIYDDEEADFGLPWAMPLESFSVAI